LRCFAVCFGNGRIVLGRGYTCKGSQVKDKEIIYIFDQNVNVVIQGLANMSGRTFEDILSLLKDGRIKVGL
jgi:hypothetical protein